MTTIRADVEAAARAMAWADLTAKGQAECDWQRDFSDAERDYWRHKATLALTASDHARLSQMPEVAGKLTRLMGWHDKLSLPVVLNDGERVGDILRAAIALLSTLQSALERKDEALRPFAELATKHICCDEWADNKTMLGSAGRGGVGYAEVTVGDFRTALAALATQPKEMS